MAAPAVVCGDAALEPHAGHLHTILFKEATQRIQEVQQQLQGMTDRTSGGSCGRSSASASTVFSSAGHAQSSPAAGASAALWRQSLDVPGQLEQGSMGAQKAARKAYVKHPSDSAGSAESRRAQAPGHAVPAVATVTHATTPLLRSNEGTGSMHGRQYEWQSGSIYTSPPVQPAQAERTVPFSAGAAAVSPATGAHQVPRKVTGAGMLSALRAAAKNKPKDVHGRAPLRLAVSHYHEPGSDTEFVTAESLVLVGLDSIGVRQHRRAKKAARLEAVARRARSVEVPTGGM